MKVTNCPKCGGDHWGSYQCPFTDEQISKMGIANVHSDVGFDRDTARHRRNSSDRLSAPDDIQVLGGGSPYEKAKKKFNEAVKREQFDIADQYFQDAIEEGAKEMERIAPGSGDVWRSLAKTINALVNMESTNN